MPVYAWRKAEPKAYRELDGKGLYFRVKPNGRKSWELRYKKPDGTNPIVSKRHRAAATLEAPSSAFEALGPPNGTTPSA